MPIVGGTTGPNPHAAGSTSQSNWWVVMITQSGRAGSLVPPTLKVTMATTKPPGAVAGPFLSQDAANAYVNKADQGGGISLPSWLNPSSWLSDIGGKLASGIEGGVISIFKDLWAVIEGPLLVLLGTLIGIWVLVIYFRDDIIKMTGMIARAAV